MMDLDEILELHEFGHDCLDRIVVNGRVIPCSVPDDDNIIPIGLERFGDRRIAKSERLDTLMHQ